MNLFDDKMNKIQSIYCLSNKYT